MSFYIDLPYNTISFPLLFKICYSRANFLNVKDQDFIKSMEGKEIYAEIMLPRSVKDNISHHLLRGLSSLNKDMWRDFVYNETRWFNFCLLSMSDREYNKFLKCIDSSVRCHKVSEIQAFDFKLRQKFLDVFGPIISQNSFQTLITSQIKRDVMVRDENAVILVPFIHVPTLFAQRKLKISNGMIGIPLCYLKLFFVEVFQVLMEASFELYNTWAKFSLKQDPRMMSILKVLMKIRGQKGCDVKATIRSNEIDIAARYFPPCMEYLHSKLRFLHRLDHHSRIQYSLFLKGIGLPYEEALNFWKREYEKPLDDIKHHNCASAVSPSSCTHVWGGNDSKRYHYNLRHLYGLEGSRRNYACHSCTQIQGKILKNRDLGGCPFTHFDEANLKRFLKSKLISHLPNEKVEEILSKILDYRAAKKFNKCCSLYYDCKKHGEIDKLVVEETTMSNPTEFYFNFTKKDRP